VSVTDEYLANNAEYAKTFSGPLPLPPVILCGRIAAS
jgi:carbonic anhydrase